jgi:hypothetical protein
MSIGTFLLRIAKTRAQKWIIYVTLAVVFVYSMVAFMASIFQCSPVSHFVSYYTFLFSSFPLLSCSKSLNDSGSPKDLERVSKKRSLSLLYTLTAPSLQSLILPLLSCQYLSYVNSSLDNSVHLANNFQGMESPNES